MSAHSAIVGGSTAKRLLACPASHSTLNLLPPSVDQPSVYAEEGSFAHAVMAWLMNERKNGRDYAYDELQVLIGQHCHDRTITQEHLDQLIWPALTALDMLEPYIDADSDFMVRAVEQRLQFPGIPGAFGTADLILQSANAVLVVDWKFGAGVPIAAVSRDDSGELIDAQALYYLTAARATKATMKLFAGKRRMFVAIVQPRTAEPLTWAEVQPRDCDDFIEDMHRAVMAALSRDPHRERGEHCRFAACKAVCPLWTGPLLDLEALGAPAATPPVSRTTNYGQYLSSAKAFLDSALLLRSEIESQIHAHLTAGHDVPGWRLKLKAKRREWVAPALVEPVLQQLGFTYDEIWRPRELVTFQVADAAAKRRGVKIPDTLREAPPSTETTIASTDDSAPVVSPALLREALERLGAPAPTATLPAAQLETGKQEVKQETVE